MLVRNGRIRFLDEHRDRLARGCERLDIQVDIDTAIAEVRDLARDATACVIKLIVTRGSATTRGYAAAGDEQARRLVLRYPDLPAGWEQQLAQEGGRVITLTAVMGENPQLAGLKHLSRLEQVVARQAMRGTGAFEGLVCSSSGRVISGTMSNMFIVRGTELLTPRLDRCGIAGVMRSIVLREAAQCGFTTREVDLARAELGAVEEAFLTSVRLGVHPIDELDGRRLRTGDTLLRLRRHIAALDA